MLNKHSLADYHEPSVAAGLALRTTLCTSLRTSPIAPVFPADLRNAQTDQPTNKLVSESVAQVHLFQFTVAACWSGSPPGL